MNSKGSYEDMPVVTPTDVTVLQDFINHPEPPEALEGWIEEQLLTFMFKPQKNRARLEWAVLAESYLQNLVGYSRADLGYAFGRLMREQKWFPELSEIIEIVEHAVSVRRARRNRARTALMKHRHEYVSPVPEDQLCRPEDVAAILAEVEAEYQAKGSST